jgi:ABC-type multidrug transport system fused ATPase/permease subunit
VNALHDELRDLGTAAIAPREPRLAFQSSLRLDNVHFRYPGAEAEALRGVNLTIKAGTSIGIIGGSGAGKSTLVDVILGLLVPQQGLISVDGAPINEHLGAWQGNIGYVPQNIYLTDDTLRRNIAFGVPDSEIDEVAIRRVLAAAQLEQFVGGLPQGLATVVGERGVRLSGGQLQRIGIARALYHDPPVLVLDEASSALDRTIERGVMEAVNALHGRKTVIIVAHRLSTIEHCDLYVRIEAGAIAETGAPARIIAAGIENLS